MYSDLFLSSSCIVSKFSIPHFSSSVYRDTSHLHKCFSNMFSHYFLFDIHWILTNIDPFYYVAVLLLFILHFADTKALSVDPRCSLLLVILDIAKIYPENFWNLSSLDILCIALARNLLWLLSLPFFYTITIPFFHGAPAFGPPLKLPSQACLLAPLFRARVPFSKTTLCYSKCHI